MTSPARAGARCEIAILDGTGAARQTVRALAEWLAPVVAELAPEARTLGVRLVGDAEMRELNRRYRHRDGSTDVLSFPGERTIEGAHLGDVAISLPTAERQAREAGHSLGRELEELVLHGLLHCLGHDHEVDDGEMERLERTLRRRWVEAGG